MIYVTHDQTEALTFADQVVVMNFGQVLQVGTPVELFERPAHTFVGHFIGSPGMNILPASVDEGKVHVAGCVVETVSNLAHLGPGQKEIGVRPEFVSFSSEGIAGTVATVMDVGRHTVKCKAGRCRPDSECNRRGWRRSATRAGISPI